MPSLFDRVRAAEASADPDAPVAKISAGAVDPPITPSPVGGGGWGDDEAEPEDDGTIVINGRRLKPLPGMNPNNVKQPDFGSTLPATMGAVGGMVPAPPGVGAILTGLFGGLGRGIEGAKESVKKLNEIGWVGPMGGEGVGAAMDKAGQDIAHEGLMQGATSYAGARAIPYIADAARGAARKGMESAMKIDTGWLKKTAGAARGGIDRTRREIIDDMLTQDIGNPLAPGAQQRIADLNQNLSTQYDEAIRAAPDVPIPGEAAAVQRRMGRELRRAGRGDAPQADVAAVRGFIEDVNTNPRTNMVVPGAPVTTRVQSPILGPNGQPVYTNVTAPGPSTMRPRNLTPRESQIAGAANNARTKELFAGRTKDPVANTLKAVNQTRKAYRDAAAGTAGITDMMRRGINMEKVAEAARKRTAATYPFSLTDVGATTASAAMGNIAPLAVSVSMKSRPLAAGSRVLSRTGAALRDPGELQRLLRRLLPLEAGSAALGAGAPPPSDDEEW